MIEFTTLTLFLATTVVIGLTPGPVIVYVIARSLQGGAYYGVLSALGAFVGGFAHIAAATLGLSVLVMQSVLAFSVLKYLGAVYLVYLGVRTLLERDTNDVADVGPPFTKLAVFRQGVITDVLNPKTALFFLAFIPQFVKVETGHVAFQFFIYGLMANAVFTLIEIVIALLAGKLGAAFNTKPHWKQGCKVSSGATLIALGGFVAFADGKRK